MKNFLLATIFIISSSILVVQLDVMTSGQNLEDKMNFVKTVLKNDTIEPTKIELGGLIKYYEREGATVKITPLTTYINIKEKPWLSFSLPLITEDLLDNLKMRGFTQKPDDTFESDAYVATILVVDNTIEVNMKKKKN